MLAGAGTRPTQTSITCAVSRRNLILPWQLTWCPAQQNTYSFRLQQRKERRKPFFLKTGEEARPLGQDMQRSMGGEQNGNATSSTEVDRLKEADEGPAERACNQAVSGLDKLVSGEEIKSQPLRHRSKALRALDFAGDAPS